VFVRVRMELVLKAPIDYQESLTFRRLAEWFSPEQPDVIKANYVYMTVFRDLAYLAREGHDPGRITPDNAGIIKKILQRVTERVDDLYAALHAGIRLFIPDGADLVCLEFASNNGHLGPNSQTKESRGGVMKHFYAEVKRADSEGFQLLLNVPAENLLDDTGQPLDHERVKQVKWLVCALDSALGFKTRPGHHYSQTLVQNAYAAYQKIHFNREVAFAVCKYIAANRKDPALNGMPTEKVLAPGGEDGKGVTVFEQVRKLLLEQ
jgi:hypothetical protein